jgi:predicted RNase H-like HicB family nuclease
MKIEYSAHILWSKEDEAYRAFVAELPGCVADGATPEEALRNASTEASEWIETAKEEGREIPQPMVLEDLAIANFKEQIQTHIRSELEKAVKRVLEQIGADSIIEHKVASQWMFLSSEQPAGGSRR